MKIKLSIIRWLTLLALTIFRMRSLVIVLLFPSIIYSMVIRRCEKMEEETWKLKIGMCIQAKDFYSKRTDCSVHRSDVGGGLITEGNGYRVVVHDQCEEPNPFIIATTNKPILVSPIHTLNSAIVTPVHQRISQIVVNIF